MEIRKLVPSEHGRTRKLYETVFYQDETRFVDYYYTCKTRNNVIYVAEDEKGIHAMLHLNPVKVCWNGKTETIYYIVAVATEQEYRHQGLMRRLLGQSLQELYEQQAPYVFLMPASEAIYTPFGFRRAWEWRWEEEMVSGSNFPDSEEDAPLKAAAVHQEKNGWHPAEKLSEQQLQELSSHVNTVLSEQFQMFVQRSPEYYRNLDREQRASGGQLEILFAEGDGQKGTHSSDIPITSRCTAKEKFPNMMTRIIHLESFNHPLKSEEEKTFYWQVKDELLPGNNGCFEIKLTPTGGEVNRLTEQECEFGETCRLTERNGELEKKRDVQSLKEVNISEIPELLENSNPFLHTMISEVV